MEETELLGQLNSPENEETQFYSKFLWGFNAGSLALT